MFKLPMRNHNFNQIAYSELNARQKENYSYQKISGVLADYGFVTMRLSDDWNGADFIAQHIDGQTLLRVQLKSRMSIAKKYLKKDLYICFPENDSWYFVPHDKFVRWALKNTKIGNTHSWKVNHCYSVPYLPVKIMDHLQQYKL